MKNIGKRIKELRKKNDLTQERLADYLGVTDKAVSKWECGLTLPDLALIVPLARILHVSADELLSGKPEEIDKRRAEFDKHCDRWMDYSKEENYKFALQAVTEYPGNYKYLTWLAHTEQNMALLQKYKEDPTLEYSVQMMESAIEHNNIVIEECNDEKLREEAMWGALVCCNTMKRFDEAKKYAEMFPGPRIYTRDKALEMCFEGENLIKYYKSQIYGDLYRLLISLSRIYWFTDRMEPHVQAALDTTESLLKTMIPDENYLGFYSFLCCVYKKRAEFAIFDGDYDGAIEYLRIMFDHAKKVPYKKHSFTCGILEGESRDFSMNHQLPYLFTGLDDLNKSVYEQLQNRLKCLDVFAPLWKREDFKELLKQ